MVSVFSTANMHGQSHSQRWQVPHSGEGSSRCTNTKQGRRVLQDCAGSENQHTSIGHKESPRLCNGSYNMSKHSHRRHSSMVDRIAAVRCDKEGPKCMLLEICIKAVSGNTPLRRSPDGRVCTASSAGSVVVVYTLYDFLGRGATML